MSKLHLSASLKDLFLEHVLERRMRRLCSRTSSLRCLRTFYLNGTFHLISFTALNFS